MTQPAQNSGHEQEFICGTCGKEYGSRRELRAHCVDLKHTLASEAQAEQPHVPEPYIEYGRCIETACECLLRCSCGWDEGDHGKMKEYPGATWLEHIQSVYPPRAAQPPEVPAEQRDEHGQIQTFEEQWARFYCKVHFCNNPNDTPTQWAKVTTHDFDEFSEHVKRHLRSLAAQPVSAAQPPENDVQWLERIRKMLPEGSPIPLFHNADGSINREKVMELPCFLWAIQRQAESAAKPPAEDKKQ